MFSLKTALSGKLAFRSVLTLQKLRSGQAHGGRDGVFAGRGTAAGRRRDCGRRRDRFLLRRRSRLLARDPHPHPSKHAPGQSRLLPGLLQPVRPRGDHDQF